MSTMTRSVATGRPVPLLAGAILIAALAAAAAVPADEPPLERGFRQPPASARPWVYWFPLDGNITSNGVTADLEALARVGIGGVLYMETDQGAPKGPAPFAGPLWRNLFKHACAEAARLGLEVNMNNDAGWCGSGGPWITPGLSMQRVVWTETEVEGPRRFEEVLAAPKAVRDFYRDIAVLAFPAPSGGVRIPNIQAKASFAPSQTSIDMRAAWPGVPADSVVSRDRIRDLTSLISGEGRLAWDVPAGRWIVLRLGHTTTGKDNHPAPSEGRGLECDKLSKAAAEAHFNGLMGRLIADVGPLAGRTLVATHIDSWEVGSQNWTPRMREEFKQRRGYDLLPFLVAMTGRVVDSMEVSERGLWDLRQTISELLLENYAGHFRTLAHRHGMRLSIEAYHTCPVDEMAYAGRCDEPMGEFWSWGKYGAAFSCTEMASAGHVYGKRIIGAEAFTANSDEKWLGHPGNVKDLGDWAFCEGINRFVFHRYALQPWADVRPGMSMGPWGLHYERTQTWWEQSKAWHEYLARCQFLLQQGRFVADLCLLSPEGSPQTLHGQKAFRSRGGGPLERPGHNFDTCPPEVVMTRMKVVDGRLTLPDGMNYRALVLPRTDTMTAALLGRIRDLVRDGATVIGPRPVKSPSLADLPEGDAAVARLARELWGEGEAPAGLTARPVGRGRVVWGRTLEPRRDPIELASPLEAAKWIWRREGNPASSAPPEKRYFRRPFTIAAGQPIAAAKLVMTADNGFECWINGRRAGAGDQFQHAYVMDVARLLRAGTNVLAVMAENVTDQPNPAGLIAALAVRYADGTSLQVATDASWMTSVREEGRWRTEPATPEGWSAAMELGPPGMAPWGGLTIGESSANDLYPDIEGIGRWLEGTGVPPDFRAEMGRPGGCIRFIHRELDGADVYFVANAKDRPEDAVCVFRVTGRRPELWWPDTGRMTRPAVYEEAGGGVRMPIHFDPAGSVFVVFRERPVPGAAPVLAVTRDGRAVCATAIAGSAAVADHAAVSNSFTLAAWVRPDAETVLPAESNRGVSGFGGGRNDALYPPPGHEVYDEPGHVGCGLSVGRNGVAVFEHGEDYFAPVLVHPAAVTGWTHVAVVYRDARPTLYLNGVRARTGLASEWTVHPGVGAIHGRKVDGFHGAIGPFACVDRALDDADVAAQARNMPRPAGEGDARSPAIELTAGAEACEARVWAPGVYTLRRADGSERRLETAAVPAAIEIGGPWEVQFAPGWGAPDRIRMDRLVSWHEHPEPGVRYFSGAATYRTAFTLPETAPAAPRLHRVLDLGGVEVMAEVRLNGRDLGILWKTPYALDVTDALRPGENTLELKVVNLWVNRQIGDEQLPEDSDRNDNGTLKSWPAWLQEGKPSPTGRFTFTSWRLWKKDDALVKSGLLGPVQIRSAVVLPDPPAPPFAR